MRGVKIGICHECFTSKVEVFPTHKVGSRLVDMYLCEKCSQDRNVTDFISEKEMHIRLNRNSFKCGVSAQAAINTVHHRKVPAEALYDEVVEPLVCVEASPCHREMRARMSGHVFVDTTHHRKVPTVIDASDVFNRKHDEDVWASQSISAFMSLSDAEALYDEVVEPLIGNPNAIKEAYEHADFLAGLDEPRLFDVVIHKHHGMREYLKELGLVHDKTQWYGRYDTICHELVKNKHVYTDWVHVDIMCGALTVSGMQLDERTIRMIAHIEKRASENMSVDILRKWNMGFNTYAVRQLHNF